LQACSSADETHADKKHLISIQKKSVANVLFYSGIIQPLKTTVVSSPAEGVIVDMPFQYGEKIKAGDLLFKLSSTKFLSDYKTALMQYIKAKSDFNNSQSQLSEANFLHRNQLISDDDFKMKQSNFYGARLALLQAKDVLDNLLHETSLKEINLYQLTIADIDKITQALHFEMNAENLRIVSPANGVILASNKNEEENKKIIKGDTIKQGDVLAIIGDMSGLSVAIKVNELTINQLTLGQPVKITGIAFPDEVLIGKINHIDKQGEVSNGSMPTFAVEVIVPTLSMNQLKLIHVGMSANVEIDLQDAPQMMIPMTAVHEKNGEAYVQLYDAKKQQSHEVAIKTGKTTMDSVAVLAGLNLGDEIVAAD
ncbi:MAG: efflux RND transporter periplasmic adaptor subunit, partial [Gammaproteobacteria bacterium]|nr:efflux RND transporter periplasmic adaptor subunit [Gammaproteobacteria bacterium]